MSVKLKTVDIKGKNYVEVNTRIAYFREKYENGSIVTEPISLENGVAIFKASIVVDDKVRATGFAYEKEGSTFINKTSYIENCETSAIGRALGIFGIGIDGSVASAEEVENAINNQTTYKTNSKSTEEEKKQYWNEFKEACEQEGIDPMDFISFLGIDSSDKKVLLAAVVKFLRSPEDLTNQILIYKNNQ